MIVLPPHALVGFTAAAAVVIAACPTATIDRGEFPMADTPRATHDDIDVARLRAMAAQQVLTKADVADALARHQRFLDTYGGGGRWQVLTLAGHVMGLYIGEGGTSELQADFWLKSLAIDVETRGLRAPWGNFCGVVLAGRDLRAADLSHSLITDADLRGADLRDARLVGADLSRADLRGADLRNADLSGADFEDADLREADLRGAVLTDGRYPGALLTGAKR